MHVAPTHCLSRIFNPNFFHDHFQPRLLQELECLLWFIMISLITCVVSQSSIYLFITMGHFDSPITKKQFEILDIHHPPPNRSYMLLLVLWGYLDYRVEIVGLSLSSCDLDLSWYPFVGIGTRIKPWNFSFARFRTQIKIVKKHFWTWVQDLKVG
jgi:hypothetical protein